VYAIICTAIQSHAAVAKRLGLIEDTAARNTGAGGG
jgi:hypothetical protein